MRCFIVLIACGWLLLIAPKKPDGSFDTTKPLRDWEQVQFFDTAADCNRVVALNWRLLLARDLAVRESDLVKGGHMNLATVNNREVARPLKILVPLIREDLKQGKEAAERAGLPYYKAAGEKMLEAKPQMPHGDFKPWIVRNFEISYSHAHRYMQFAEVTQGYSEKSLARDFSSLSDAIRQTSNPNYNKPHTVRPTAWDQPVREAVNRVNVDRLMQDRQDRDKEQRLVNIGFTFSDCALNALVNGQRR